MLLAKNSLASVPGVDPFVPQKIIENLYINLFIFFECPSLTLSYIDPQSQPPRSPILGTTKNAPAGNRRSERVRTRWRISTRQVRSSQFHQLGRVRQSDGRGLTRSGGIVGTRGGSLKYVAKTNTKKRRLLVSHLRRCVWLEASRSKHLLLAEHPRSYRLVSSCIHFHVSESTRCISVPLPACLVEKNGYPLPSGNPSGFVFGGPPGVFERRDPDCRADRIQVLGAVFVVFRGVFPFVASSGVRRSTRKEGRSKVMVEFF